MCAAYPTASLQVRANGLIVFVPKYGIEGPVYLEDSAAAAAAAAADGGAGPSSGSSRKQGAAAAAAAAESNFVYDEEKQVGSGLHVLACVRVPSWLANQLVAPSACAALSCLPAACSLRPAAQPLIHPCTCVCPASSCLADLLLQTVRSKDGSAHYTVFDKCAVR